MRPLELGTVFFLLLPVAFIISLIVITLSWVAYRPFLASPFLAIVADNNKSLFWGLTLCLFFHLSAVAGFVYYRIRNRQHQLSSASVVPEADVITYTEGEEHDLELQPIFRVQERVA
jgi:hypothetical protein